MMQSEIFMNGIYGFSARAHCQNHGGCAGDDIAPATLPFKLYSQQKGKVQKIVHLFSRFRT